MPHVQEKLELGKHSKNIYWAVKGNTGLSGKHLTLFHECGISSKNYQNNVWVIANVKFLRPFDTINQNHLNLLTIYDTFKLNNRPTSDEMIDPLPFNTFMIYNHKDNLVCGGDGPLSNLTGDLPMEYFLTGEYHRTIPRKTRISVSSVATTNNTNTIKPDAESDDDTPNKKKDESDDEGDEAGFSLFD